MQIAEKICPKILLDFFKTESIRYLLSFPYGEKYITIWFKLIIMAAQMPTPGYIRNSNKNLDTVNDYVSVFTETNIHVVNIAVRLFREAGMIEADRDHVKILDMERWF